MMTKSAGSARVDNFMSLRVFAAIIVIYGHAFPLTGTVSPGYLGNPIQTIAVKIFFVISGYMITLSWMRDSNPIRYLQRRFLRIFPALMGLCLVTVFLFGPVLTTMSVTRYFNTHATYQYFSNLVLNPVYYLPGVFEHLPYPIAVNGSLWTLPIEFTMYLAMPVVLMLGRSFLIAVTLASIAASLWFCRIAVPEVAPVVWGSNVINALEMFPYFLIGTVVAAFSLERFLNVQVGIVGMVVIPIFATNWITGETASLVLVPYVVLAFGMAKPPVLGAAARLGDISYGLYLYGFLVQQCVAHFVGTAEQPLLNFVLSTIATVLLATLSWRFIEQPALRWKPSQSASRRVQPSE